MNIIPDSDIILLKCPLELDNKNQITFATAEAQFNYFNSLTKITLDSASYVRKDETIRVPELLEDILQYNYLMYRNHNYSNKWIYAFITDSQYLNDNCTSISFETDVFQTWQFDLEYKKSFVIREHTNNDAIGANILDEGLDSGDMITINHSGVRYGLTGCKIVVMSTYDPYNHQDFTGLAPYNGTMFGCAMWAFDNDTTGVGLLQTFIQTVNSERSSSAIQGMFMCPNELLSGHIKTNENNIIEGTWTVYSNIETYYPYGATPYTDYVPKNNKCYCWPYHFLEVSNSNGEKQQYRIEDFAKDERGNILFTNYMALQVGISGRLCPTNYKGTVPALYGSDDGVTLAKFPCCQWASDYYTNWLTQNSINRIRTVAGTEVGGDTSILKEDSGDILAQLAGSGIKGFASQVAGLVGKHAAARMNANQVAGDNSGDVSFSMGANGYTFLEKRSKLENLKIIDEYFTMFGYKTNRLKVPNITGRSNWNYVETENANIIADIPQNDLDTIKRMFNNGITLWHTTTYFLDYSRTNSIV